MIVVLNLLLVLSGGTNDPIDPDAAVQRALANARSLSVARAQIERQRHAAGRVDLRDVRLGLDHFGVAQMVAPLPGDSADVFDNTQVALSWRPPRLDELGLVQSIAAARVEEGALDVEAKMRDIAAETRLLHAHILLLRDERSLLQDTLALLQKSRDLIDAKLQASLSTQVELSLATMDVLDAQLDLDEVNSRVARSEARFARLIGMGDDEPVALSGEVPLCRAPPDAEATLAVARKHSPKLHALALERSALKLESLQKSLKPVPWIDRVRVSYWNGRPFDGRDEFHVGVDVDLPLFVLLDGFGDNAVDLRRVKLEAETLEAEEDVESAIAAVVLRQRSAAALFEEHAKATATVVADSTSAVDAALASGSADAVGAAAVHTRALKSKRAHVRARARCAEAVIDLWRTTGEVIVIGDPAFVNVRIPPASK